MEYEADTIPLQGITESAEGTLLQRPCNSSPLCPYIHALGWGGTPRKVG